MLILLLVYTPSETLKIPVKFRQNNLCANQAAGVFVANPLDCKRFYLCGENGEAVPASCPPNMLFNPVSKICDTQDNVRCETTTVQPPVTTAPTPSPTEAPPSSSVVDYCLNVYSQQPSADSLIFLAHPSNCHRYYMCYYGQALLQECSTDLQWNSRIGKCDLPSNAKCQSQGGNIPVPIAPTDSAPIGDNGIVCPVYGQHIFPHMQRCDFFIYCVKGHALLQQCPFYQYFDVESSRCKWRKVALCIKDLKLEFRKNTF